MWCSRLYSWDLGMMPTFMIGAWRIVWVWSASDTTKAPACMPSWRLRYIQTLDTGWIVLCSVGLVTFSHYLTCSRHVQNACPVVKMHKQCADRVVISFMRLLIELVARMTASDWLFFPKLPNSDRNFGIEF